MTKEKSHYVGEFNENDIVNGLDKIAVEKARKETGLNYVNSAFVKKDGKIVAIRIWVCDLESFKL